jgi:transposase InsO family protein
MLTVLDEFTRENLAIRVERSINSQRVIDTLQWLFMLHGEPGCHWQNPYIESYHDKLRDECLKMELFDNGHHAQEVVEHWRTVRNEQPRILSLRLDHDSRAGQSHTVPPVSFFRIHHSGDARL